MHLSVNVAQSLSVFLDRFRALPFYLVAFLLHVLFFLIFGTLEVTTASGAQVVTLFTAPAAQKPDAANVPAPPPPPTREEKNTQVQTLPNARARATPNISVAGSSSTAFNIPPPTVLPTATTPQSRQQTPDLTAKVDLQTANLPAVKLRQLLSRAARFVSEGSAVSGTGKSTRAQFACYWAIYQGGDWNCNPTALTNLTIQVSRWSRGKIIQKKDPQPIVVSSKDLFTIKPPFIFITGHKDFTFTEEEIENLRQYLHAGGAIWADNSLPGRRSRFDMAFRREMKRVLTNKDFEPLPDNHQIMLSYFTLREMPSGMNFYREPVEIIRLIADEIAVIYTLNAYSDLWESALDENDRIDRQLYRTGPRSGYYKWGPHYGSYYTGTHYRNVNDETVPAAYKLGINIVVHLLTRYEDRLRAMGVK